MSKLTGWKRLIIEDVEEQFRPLMDKIASSVNPFAEEVVRAFEKNISVDDNLTQFFKDLTIQVDSNGIPTTGGSFKNTLSNSIKGLIVIKCDNTTNSTSFPSGYPFINFTESSSNIVTINHITGLTANNKYNIRLFVIG